MFFSDFYLRGFWFMSQLEQLTLLIFIVLSLGHCRQCWLSTSNSDTIASRFQMFSVHYHLTLYVPSC